MRFLIYILSVITAFTLSAANVPDDSGKALFTVDHHRFDPSIGEDPEAMTGFINTLKQAFDDDRFGCIVIRVFISDADSIKADPYVSSHPCEAIANFISTHVGIHPELIHLMPDGIGFNEIRQLVIETHDCPAHFEILDIMGNVPAFTIDNHGHPVDNNKDNLPVVDGESSHGWMYQRFNPALRNPYVVTILKNHHAKAPHFKKLIASANKLKRPTTEALNTTTSSTWEMVLDRTAVKTNLLGYPVLMPNLEVEYKFADRWSAALEWQGAWYSKTPPHRTYRVSTVIPEVRYWAIERSRWHGLYVGAFAGWGQYDLCNGGHKGHKGEGFLGGISAGYMWPINKYLSFDAAIGLGYSRIHDRLYRPVDGHYLYQLSKNINYFGPLRLKFSLVWRLETLPLKSKK